MRTLVTIKTIDDLKPIEGADRIENAIIGGWSVVTQKNIHKVGDNVAYFEIDTFLPEGNPLFDEYVERGTKKSTSPYTDQEVQGHVLRTIKIRGQYSQGTIMPLHEIGLREDSTQEEIQSWMKENGVFKYEPKVNLNTGSAKGSFPSIVIMSNTNNPVQVRKTDSERVQNLSDEWLQSLNAQDWFATEKLDGTSFTAVCDDDGETHIASRNLEISIVPDAEIEADRKRYAEEHKKLAEMEKSFMSRGEEIDYTKLPRIKKVKEKSLYQTIADRLDLFNLMNPGQLIQGEIVGPNIQGNKLNLDNLQLFVFHTEGIDKESTLYKDIVSPREVPKLDMELPTTVSQAIEQVDGMKSTVNPKVLAEGVVWWNRKGEVFTETGMRPNFKAINNKFLLKNGE